MAGKNPEVKVEYKVVNQAFNKGISEMNSKVTTLNKEFGVQKEQMKNTASESEKLESSIDKLNQEYTLAEQKTKMVESALQNTKEITGESSKETERWANKLLDAQKNQEHLKNAILESNQALDKAKQAESQLAAEQDKLAQNTKRLETLFESTGNSLDDYVDVLGTRMVSAIRNGEASSDQLELAINKIGKAALGTDADLGKMKNALDQVDNGSSIDDVSQDLRELSTQSDKTADALEDMGDKISAGNLLEGAEALSEVSEKVTEIATASFESAMTIDDLAHRYNNAFGLTGEEAEKTKDKIISMYKTGLVDSYEEAAEVLIETREQLGNLNNESLDDITKRAVAFTKTFDADMPETLRGANALMQAYGYTAEQSFDLMTVAAQRGLNKTDELGDNLAEYANQFELNGYSAEEMFETLEAGISGGAYNLDKVNDLVKEFGVRISDSTMKTAVEELGGEWQNMYNQMSKDGASNQEIFEALAGKIGEVGSETEKAALVSAIFGSLGEDNAVQVIEAMSKLNKEVSGIEGSYEDVNGASTKLMKASDSMNLTQQWRELQDLLRPIGEQLMQVAIEYMPKVIEAVKGIVEWFKNLSPYGKIVAEFIGIFAGLSVILAPIVAGIAGIVALLGTMIGPFALVVAAIASLIVWIKNWGAISDWLSEKWSAFTEWLGQSWSATVEKAKEIFSALGEYFSNLWTSITDTASLYWTNFTTFLSEKWNAAIGQAREIWSGLTTFFSGIWSNITTTAIEAWTSFASFMAPIIQGLVKVIQVPISFLATILEGIWLLMKAGAIIAFEALKIAASSAWTAIKNNIVNPVSEAWNLVSGKLQEIWSGMVTKFDQIKVAASEKWNAIKNTISTSFTNAKNTVLNIATSIWSAVTSKFEQVRNSAVEKWNAVKNAITTPITNAKNTAASVASSIWSTLTSKFEQIRSATVNKFNAVKDAIITPIQKAKDKIGGIIDGIKNFFSNLKLKIPTPSLPKLPKFGLKTATKTVFGKDITYPTGFNVKWNAKGGILKQPAIFGAMGNTLLGGGEVPGESEAILPLNNHVLSSIGVGIMQALDKKNTDNALSTSISSAPLFVTVQSILDGRVVADAMTDPIDVRLSNKSSNLNFGTTGRF